MSVVREFDYRKQFKHQSFTIAVRGDGRASWRVHGWRDMVETIARLLYGGMANLDIESYPRTEALIIGSKDWHWSNEPEPAPYALDLTSDSNTISILRDTDNTPVETAWKKCSLCGAESRDQALTSCIDELNPTASPRCPGENCI